MTTRKGCKKLWLLVSCVGLCHAVNAAPIFQGTYWGGFVAGNFGYDNVSTTVGGVTDSSYFTTNNDANAVSASGSGSLNPNSGILGIQAGHNWGYKRAVYGAVLDFSSLSYDATQTQNNISYPGNSGQYSIQTSMQASWLLTLRAIAGCTMQWHWPSLLYGTAGLAMTEFDINNTFSDNRSLSGAGTVQNKLYDLGWTIGLGVDSAVMQHVFLNVEYLFVDMPSVTTNGSITNAVDGFGVPAGSAVSPFTTTNQFHTNLLKFGIDYHFAG